MLHVEMLHGGAGKEHGGAITLSGENPHSFSRHLMVLSLQITLFPMYYLKKLLTRLIYADGAN